MAFYRALNVKQMLDVYLSCTDDAELLSLLNSFVVMRDHGFISPYDWSRFCDKAEGWYFDNDVGRVLPCPTDGDLF